MKPKRIQRQRSKGWRMPENTVYVGRPTRFGNTFEAGRTYHAEPFGGGKMDFWRCKDSAEAVRLFRQALTTWPEWKETRDAVERELRGKNLACWCSLDKPCHADVLIELANQ